MRLFKDRVEAGRRLGAAVAELGLSGDILVLGLPRGGVPVACEVGAALHAPVDVLVVRKIGAPFNPELALGAIAFGGVTVLNEDLLAEFRLDRNLLHSTIERERAELARREHAYRAGRPPLEIAGKTVVIVDDGMATGASMHAAVVAARKLEPAGIVVAVPTAAVGVVTRIERVADQVAVLATPEPYCGVGVWYSDFRQLTDDDVIAALERAAQRQAEDDRAGLRRSDGSS